MNMYEKVPVYTGRTHYIIMMDYTRVINIISDLYYY